MNVINWNSDVFINSEGILPTNLDIFRILMNTRLDKNNLPAPIATVATSNGTYTDNTAVDGVRYRYHIVPEGRYTYNDDTPDSDYITQTFTFTIDI